MIRNERLRTFYIGCQQRPLTCRTRTPRPGRVLPLCVLALLLASAPAQTAQADDKDFRFIVMGDNRPGGDATVEQPPKYFETIDEINLLDPDLVVNGGDLIKGYVEDEDLVRKMWAEFERVSAKIRVPWYRVFGNHDIWNAMSQRVAEELYGDLYYSFTHKGAYFAVLCSDLASEMDQITGEQLEWLKKNLRRHRRRRPKFVFLHKPLWKEENSNWLSEVHPILAAYDVDMVFAGHAHKYEKSRTRDAVQYFITGGAGAPLREDRTPEQGWFHHYIQVSVRDDALTVAVVKTGSVKHEEIITYETE